MSADASVEDARAEEREEASRNTAALVRLAHELADEDPAPLYWRHVFAGCRALNHAPDGVWRACSTCGEVCDDPAEAVDVTAFVRALPPRGVHVVAWPPRCL